MSSHRHSILAGLLALGAGLLSLSPTVAQTRPGYPGLAPRIRTGDEGWSNAEKLPPPRKHTLSAGDALRPARSRMC